MAKNRLFHRERRIFHGNNGTFDGQEVIQPAGFEIMAFEVPHHELGADLFVEVGTGDSHAAQQLRAPSFAKSNMTGVVHDPARVGVFIINPEIDRMQHALIALCLKLWNIVTQN